MASPSTPTHGRLAALYRMRPHGFKGDGLNDVTWGTGFAGADSSYFEVVIDAEDTPDTFKWRQDGGGWTEDVAITGAAQTLADSQTITFAATTGHTLSDQWVIGNLKDEPTSESGAEAQITDTLMRLLNPNTPPTFTDDGGESVLTIDYTQGKATFSGNVGNVDVDGNDGYIVEAALEQVGYCFGWNLDFNVDMADASRLGQKWKEAIPGQAGATIKADSYLIMVDTFFDGLVASADGSLKYLLLELFNYDPDQDQTGDHFICWAGVTGLNVSAPIGDVVKESVSFSLLGMPSHKANA